MSKKYIFLDRQDIYAIYYRSNHTIYFNINGLRSQIILIVLSAKLEGLGCFTRVPLFCPHLPEAGTSAQALPAYQGHLNNPDPGEKQPHPS